MAILPPRGPNSPRPGPMPMPRNLPWQSGGQSQQTPSYLQAYPASVTQTGQDYSNIMAGYQNTLKNVPGQTAGIMQNYQNALSQPSSSTFTPSTFTPARATTATTPNLASAQQTTYTQSPENARALSILEGLSTTGGYSEEDKANLRARGVSPIRSVYANAMQNMDRQRALSGGYSPNFAASSGRMARELSEQIAGQVTNVNAGIAENVAQGRLSAAPQYAQAAGQQTSLMNQIALANAAAGNQFSLANFGAQGQTAAQNAAAQNAMAQANAAGATQNAQFNASQQLSASQAEQARQQAILNAMSNASSTGTGNELAALQGMTSLYGTTPALASTFGNQALQAAQLQQNAPQTPFRGGGMAVNNFPGTSQNNSNRFRLGA